MLSKIIYTILTAGLGANALVGKKPDCADHADVNKVLIGGGPSGTISVADFDGSSFDIVANNTIAGTSASWLLFKEPNLLYAVDENGNTTRLFHASRFPCYAPRRRSKKIKKTAAQRLIYDIY